LFIRSFKELLSLIFAMSFSHGLFAFENKTFEKVLKNNFKNCILKKENIFLKHNDQDEITKRLGLKISALLLRYKSECYKSVSYIYIDSHIVRSLNETVVIEIKNKKLNFIQIASFMEPREYLPPKNWLELFLLNDQSKVDALTGATLSQNAIKNTVKKYLVINRVLSNE
jgi:hypothetical protein